MDITRANTRAFTHYNSFHELLNRSVKTAAVSLIILKDDIVKSRRSIAAIKGECYELKTLWGGMPDWSSETAAIDAIGLAQHDLGASGVVKAFSAFDVFLETLEGELNSWKSFSRSKGCEEATSATKVNPEGDGDCPPADATEETEPNARLLRFFERHGWGVGDVEYLLPIYTYFQLLRNCVAHTDARVTPALQASSQAKKWNASIAEWKKKTTDLTMPIPHELLAGSRIKITYKEAILASSMLRMLAWSMSRRAVASLGETGVLYVLISRILKERATDLVGGKQHLSRLHHHLKFVYRIDKLTIADTKERLQELDLWETWRAWHESVVASENATALKTSSTGRLRMKSGRGGPKRTAAKASHET